MYGQKLIDVSGITRLSLKTWKMTRPLFGEFKEAFCSRSTAFRRHNLTYQQTIDDDYVPLGGTDGPGLVLVDENSSELWLGGCAAGFTGEGVAGTGYILRAEGFTPAHIDLVPQADLLQVRKYETDPVAYVPASDTPTLHKPWSQHIESLIASGYFKDVEAL